MPVLDLGSGLAIHYLDLNPQAEKTVLLLHGLGADGSSWGLQFPTLTDLGYRIVAPDSRGFGCSSYPQDSPATIEVAAADFVRLVESLNRPRLDVVGISMGGTQALAFTLACPERVGRLVLVNTFAHLRPHGLSEWLYYAWRFALVHTVGLEAQAHAVAARIFPKPDQAEVRRVLIEQIMQANPRAYRAALRALAKFNVTDRLSEIDAPTLVITAEQDTTVPQDVQQQLLWGLRNARQVFIPDAGHAVTIDQADRVNRLLADFLDGNRSQS